MVKTCDVRKMQCLLFFHKLLKYFWIRLKKYREIRWNFRAEGNLTYFVKQTLLFRIKAHITNNVSLFP